MTDVIFLTNRKWQNTGTSPDDYSFAPAPRVTTGIARVEQANVAKLVQGKITAISHVTEGGLSAEAAQRIAQASHVLFFVHGFANSFANSIAVAGFLREWLALETGPAADLLVVAFAWPSHGKILGFEKPMPAMSAEQIDKLAATGLFQLPGSAAYLGDQQRARASGMAFLTALDWLREAMGAPRPERKFFLMAHSMGNEMLAHALDQPPAPEALIFDETFLIAADAAAARKPPVPEWLRMVDATSRRAHIYFSIHDSALITSRFVNPEERLGFLGRAGMDQSHSPGFRFVDCSATIEDDREPVEGNAGHWYYRRVPSVRADIARAMAGEEFAASPTVIPAANPLQPKSEPPSPVGK